MLFAIFPCFLIHKVQVAITTIVNKSICENILHVTESETPLVNFRIRKSLNQSQEMLNFFNNLFTSETYFGVLVCKGSIAKKHFVNHFDLRYLLGFGLPSFEGKYFGILVTEKTFWEKSTFVY